MSFPDVQTVVNTIWFEQGLVFYQLPTIKGTIERMKSRIVCIEKKPHGNYDKKSDWERARAGFTLQLLVRLGKISEADVRKQLGLKDEDDIPDSSKKIK